MLRLRNIPTKDTSEAAAPHWGLSCKMYGYLLLQITEKLFPIRCGGDDVEKRAECGAGKSIGEYKQFQNLKFVHKIYEKIQCQKSGINEQKRCIFLPKIALTLYVFYDKITIDL